jgi:hypothetical protein
MTNVHNLIYDLGCHNGQDSDFYLKKGFTVVAAEAYPGLCDRLKLRFRPGSSAKKRRAVGPATARRSLATL